MSAPNKLRPAFQKRALIGLGQMADGAIGGRNQAASPARGLRLNPQLARVVNPLLCPADEPIQIESSTAWKVASTATPPAGWHLAGFDDSGYANAIVTAPESIWYDGDSSRWIYDPADDPAPASFRHEFELTSIPSAANLRFTLDNYGAVYVNGHLVATRPDVMWGAIGVYSLDPGILVEGTNCISVIAHSDGIAPQGIYVLLTLGTGAGTSQDAAHCDHFHEFSEPLTPWASMGFYDIRDYGAVCDNVTDDSAAIQAAINACLAAGGGTVYTPGEICYIGNTLKDTGTYNSLLEIPDAGGTYKFIRFLGVRNSSTWRTDWAGSISGNPSIISAGTHDSNTWNVTYVTFEDMSLAAPVDPKLSAIDMTKAVALQFRGDNYIYANGDASVAVPTHSNAIAVDWPWGYNDQRSYVYGALDVSGFYTAYRPPEQFHADYLGTAYCARGVELRGQQGSPAYLRHATYIERLNIWETVRGIVFTGDQRWVYVGLYDSEQGDASPWSVVYDIDDASNYGYGFIAWHTTNYASGPVDNLLVNGGSNLSLHGGFAKRWKLNNVVDIPTGTNPSTNPATGRRLYAASADGHLTVRKPDGTTLDLEAPGGVTGFATPNLTFGTANAAGSATTVIRSDATILAFDSTVPVTQALGDAAATGSSTVAARRDHKHAVTNPLTTKGDLIVGGASGAINRLGVGSDNQVLTADSAQTLGVKWATPTTGFADPTTTKGDLIVHGTSTTRLGVGSDGQVLTADSTQTLGVKWATPSTGFSDPTTAKGDLIVHGSSTTRMAVGSNGQFIIADSSQTLGMKWFTPSYADVYRNSAQNLTSGGFTQVNYDTVSNQSADNPWDNTNHNFKCPIAGRYAITAVVGFNPAVALTATAALSLYVNGTEQKRGLQVQTGTWSSFVSSFQCKAAANDTLDIRVFQAQGVNVALGTGAVVTHAEFAYIGPV